MSFAHKMTSHGPTCFTRRSLVAPVLLLAAAVLLTTGASTSVFAQAGAAQVAPVAPTAPAPLPSPATAAAPRAAASSAGGVRTLSTPVRAVGAAAVVLPMEDLNLVLGEIRMVPVRGKVRRIAVGNGANVSATTVDASLLLIGEQPGATTLMVWTDREIYSYRVRVVSPDLAATRRLIDSALRGTTGITVEENDSRFLLSGFAGGTTIERVTALLKDAPNVRLDLRSDNTDGPLTRSVLFRLHFVEVNKSLLENIGIQWSKDMAGPTFATQGVAASTGIYRGLPPATAGDNLLSTAPNFVSRNGAQSGIFFGLASAITSRINLGVSDGDARILASPELTAKSGGKARLQVGGEIPIPMAGAFGAQTVEFKPYGIIFSIEPLIDGSGAIVAKISTELSQIDPAVSINGIPGFLTRSTATEISVRPGEMIALSGLVNNELSNAIDRVPGLGNVPILGRLFRSDDYRNKKTDLVILLEPEIINPGDGLASQLRERGIRNTREFNDRVTPPPPTPVAPVPVPRVDNPIGR